MVGGPADGTLREVGRPAPARLYVAVELPVDPQEQQKVGWRPLVYRLEHWRTPKGGPVHRVYVIEGMGLDEAAGKLRRDLLDVSTMET